MADPGLEGLGARVVAIAQALASGKDPSTDQLRGPPAEGADRLHDTQKALEDAANARKQRAQDRVDAATVAKAAAEQLADSQLNQTMDLLQQQRVRAVAEADRADAAALAGFEQAQAMGSQEMEAATATRDAAVKAANKVRTDANKSFDAAVKQATTLANNAKQAANKVVADAQQELASAKSQPDQQAQAGINGAVAAVAGLPEEVVALGPDALERLEGALTWPSGILSLVATTLIWIKKHWFPAEDALQVIWHEPVDGPVGLGLQWSKDEKTLRLVYRPPVPPADGAGTLLIEAMGADTIPFAAPDNQVSATFVGHADQQLVVGKGIPGPDAGLGDAKLTLAFGGLHFDRQFGPLTTKVETPTLTAALAHTNGWKYDVTLDLPAYSATLRLSDLLNQAGLPIPISVPSIDEHRSLKLSVVDGRFTAHEGAT